MLLNPDHLAQLPEPLAQRIIQHFPDFLHSYHAIYPDATQEHLDKLIDMLAEVHEQRAPRLQQLDETRETRPDWFQEPRHVGMMLYVDLFAWNLKGVMEHIPYLKELGVTYLHLMPLLQPRKGPNDGGYAVADYRNVDKRLGTMKDLRDLALQLHEEDILLVIDLVMNHTAKEHRWAQAALKGDPFYQDFYLLFDDRELPDEYEKSLPEVFPDFAPGNFTFQPDINKWVWTTFYDFQWDLNFRNPEVFAAMLGEMLFLANCGVDVLRLDAVPFLWKNMGTNCQNQPEAVHILAAYRALVRMAAPGVLFKSEAIVAPDDIIKYLGSGGMEGKVCEIGYNATLMNHLWHALASENTHLLRTTLSLLPQIPQEATWLNYIRCHDDIGWGISDANAATVNQDGRGTRNFCTDFYAGMLPNSYAEGYVFQRDRRTGEARISGTAAALSGLQKAQIEADPVKIDLALRRLALLNGVTFFMKGIPLIYAGDEIGQLNDFSYLLNPEKAADNRWVHRPPMNWQKAEQRKIKGTPEQRLFDLHKRYAQVRAGQHALHGRSEDRILIPDNDHIFLCERTYEGEQLLLVANLSRQTQRAGLKGLPEVWQTNVFEETLSGTSLHFTNNEIVVPGYGVYWLKPSNWFKSPGLKKLLLRVHVEVSFGEQVYLSGSNAALGAWQVSNALPASSTDYPWWTVEVDAPTGEAFAYQWIRMRNREIIQWSPQTYYAMAGWVE